MPDRVQDLKNHRQVAVACKNYTDSEIKKSEGRILSIVARNNVDFIDHTDEATYRFTAPANSKLLMLQSIAGNSVKYSPSVASDSTTAYQKNVPSYSPSIDRASASMNILGGMSYKVNQVLGTYSETYTQNSMSIVASNGSWVLSGTATGGDFNYVRWLSGFNTSHKYLVMVSGFSGTASTKFIQLFSTMLTNNGMIVTPTSTGGNIQYYCYEGNGDNKTYYPNIFDLTTDFGSGNEPTSVSDCATEYAKRGINIYEYTPKISDIRDTAPTSVKSVGFNKGNSEWILGAYSGSTGGYIENNQYVCNNQVYLIVKPNTTYTYVSSPARALYFHFYDINKQYIRNSGVVSSGGTFTTPDNCYYIRYNSTTNEIATNNLVMINEGTTAQPYKPYFTSSLLIDSHIQALDGYGWGIDDTYYNYIDFNAKKFKKVVGKYTFTGNEVFNAYGDGYRFDGLVGLTANKYNSFISDINLPILATPTSIASGDSGMHLSNTGYFYLSIDVSQVVGKTIYYELATPIEIDISEYLDGSSIEIEPNGTLSFESTYSAYVPSNVSYNGVIKHALATAVKQDGFNIWDEQKELGGYDQNTGAKTSSSITYRNVNPIAVRPNTEYYIKKKNGDAGFIYYYDSNMNYISASYRNTSTTFTTPSNCYFINFTSMASTWLNETCINISNQALNGTYKPYKAPLTRLLPNSEAKYSWGITDGIRNVRTYCDDEGNAVNEGQVDVSNQDLGGIGYIADHANHRFYGNVPNNKTFSVTEVGNIICSKYPTISVSSVVNGGFGIGITTSISISDIGYESLTASQFKTAMSGKILYYQKNTTDTETLDDFDYFFDCEEGDTFTLVNTEQLQCYATYSFLIKEAKSNE